MQTLDQSGRKGYLSYISIYTDIVMNVTTFAKCLSDPTRARLANLLLRFELNVGEIVQVMAMGQSRISRHLKILTDGGILTQRKDGLWVFYRCSDPQTIGGRFIACLHPFFEQDEQMRDDLHRAARIIEERTTDTKRFFDSIAPKWSRLSQEVLGDFDLAGEIASALPACTTAVDLGCGTGEFLPILRQRADQVIGVDNSPRMLAQAEKRLTGLDGISLRIGELSHLPLRDQEADAGLLSLVLHHLTDPRAVIQEISRVLRPGGTFVVIDFVNHHNEMMRKRFGDRWLGFDPAELETWLEAEGFTCAPPRLHPVNHGLSIFLINAHNTKEHEHDNGS